MTEMPLYQQVLTICICAFATMGTRMLPFFLFKPGRNLPPYVQYLGKALPSAVFALLIVYCLKDVELLAGSHGVPEAVSLLLTVCVHLWKRNMLLSMALGTVCYMALVQFVFS